MMKDGEKRGQLSKKEIDWLVGSINKINYHSAQEREFDRNDVSDTTDAFSCEAL